MSDEPVINDPKAVLEALEKAKKEAKQFREERDAALKQVEELSEAPKAWQDKAVKAEAKARLLGMGIKDTERLIKYLKTDDVKLEDDKFSGLDEQIEQVKKDFPELFDKKRQVGGSADAFATGEAPKLTGTQAQVKRVFSHAS